MKIDVGVRFRVSLKSINTPPSLAENCSKDGAGAKRSLIRASLFFLTSFEEHCVIKNRIMKNVVQT